MKNLLFGFSVFVLAFASCKKEDKGPPDSNEQGEYFNCKIDGKYWTYKQAYFTSHDDLIFRSYFNDAGYEIIGENGVDFPQTVVSFRIPRWIFQIRIQ
jgi:hypothetical protein